jgi:hypothetical protein
MRSKIDKQRLEQIVKDLGLGLGDRIREQDWKRIKDDYNKQAPENPTTQEALRMFWRRHIQRSHETRDGTSSDDNVDGKNDLNNVDLASQATAVCLELDPHLTWLIYYTPQSSGEHIWPSELVVESCKESETGMDEYVLYYWRDLEEKILRKMQ